MVDVGVDLHKNYSQVAVLDAWGEIRQEHIEHQGRDMEEFVRSLEPGSRLAVEATGNWWWFVDLVESQGHQVVMSNPKETKAIAHARLKNDRVDAEKLAVLLRSGFLPQVWIAPAAIRYAKEVLRYRPLLVGMRTKLRNHFRSHATEAESARTQAEPLGPEGRGLRGERGLECGGGPDTT